MKNIKSLILSTALVAIAIISGGESIHANDTTITVVSREDGSGTRGAFVEVVGVLSDDTDNTTVDAIIHDGTGKVITAVQNDPNAIGYVSLGSLNDTVKAVAIEGIMPSHENVKNGTYKVARPFIITMKQNGSPLQEDFINYIISNNGQRLANENGFISLYENGPFKSTLPSGDLIIGGSTSVYPLMEKLAEDYKTNNPKATINIEAIGSSAGIKGSIDGTFDIGMASRELKESEKSAISYREIASDGIVIILNKANKIETLTMPEVAQIYQGELTRFSDLKK